MNGTEITLLTILVLTQCFWMIHCQKLVDKLMSRNYGEYLQAQASAQPKAPQAPGPEEPNEDLSALSDVVI